MPGKANYFLEHFYELLQSFQYVNDFPAFTLLTLLICSANSL